MQRRVVLAEQVSQRRTCVDAIARVAYTERRVLIEWTAAVV
jgi:hypothetical protein